MKKIQHTYLSHDSDLFPNARKSVFFAYLQIHVNKLMRESWKFVTKTYGVRSADRRHKRVTIELRFYLSVNNFFGWSLDQHIDIVLAPGDHLKKTSASVVTINVINTQTCSTYWTLYWRTCAYLVLQRNGSVLLDVFEVTIFRVVLKLESQFDRIHRTRVKQRQ